MTVADEIQRLQGAKQDLKTAINAKNTAQNQITDEKLEDYAGFVDKIPTGGKEYSLTYGYVTFMDCYGNILYTYTKEEVQALTAMPPVPEEEGFRFTWNWTLDQLKESGRQVVGAVRETLDGSTRVKVRFFPGDTCYIPMSLSYALGTITIEWGDGTTDTYTNNTSTYQNITAEHTYSKHGEYTISLKTDGNAYYRFPANVFSTSTLVLTRIIDVCIGDRLDTYVNSSLYGLTNLKGFSIPYSFPARNASQFMRTSEVPILIYTKVVSLGRGAKLKGVSLSGGASVVQGESISDGGGFNYLCIPHTVTSIGGYAARSCGAIGTVLIPSSVRSIGIYAITGTINNIDLSMYDDPSNLPTLSGSTAFNASYYLVKNQEMKEAFEGAQYWSDYTGQYVIGGEYAG